MAAVVSWNNGSDRSTVNLTSACSPPLIRSTLLTLPTSTPAARTNCPSRRPLTFLKIAEYSVVRLNRICPNTTKISAVNVSSTSEKMPSLKSVPLILMG